MKILKYITILLLLSITPCYAFDWKGLDGDNIVDKIIDSIEKEPEKWLIRNNSLAYFEDDEYRKKASTSTWPESRDGCLIEISHDVLGYDDGYVIIDKPFKVHKREYYKKLTIAIRQLIYNYLHNENGIRLTEKKVVKEQKKEEPVKVVENKPKKPIDDRYGNMVEW